MCDVLLKDRQATIPLEAVSTKARTLLGRLEGNTVSTSWRRKQKGDRDTRGEEKSGMGKKKSKRRISQAEERLWSPHFSSSFPALFPAVVEMNC